MKLLVLYPREEKEKALAMESVLRGLSLTLFYEEMKSERTDELALFLPKYPCFLLFHYASLPEQNWFHLLKGYSLGSGISGALFSETGCKAFAPNVKAFKNEKQLLKFLSQERQNWIRREEIRKAREKLKKLGYSFNSDAFAYAVTEDDKKAIPLFIRGGFSVDGVNSRGTPLLCLAARRGSPEAVELLVASGASVNKQSKDRGSTPLMDAASQGNPDIVRFLIDSGAALDIIGRGGQTALVLAVGRKNTGIAKLLIEAGACLDTKDDLGMDALAYARLFKLADVEAEILSRRDRIKDSK